MSNGMATTTEDDNQSAYWRLKDAIDSRYEKGRFVAIVDGQVFADADSFVELRKLLQDRLGTPHRALIVQSGVHYPKRGVILA